jgi:hypothetical protein
MMANFIAAYHPKDKYLIEKKAPEKNKKPATSNNWATMVWNKAKEEIDHNKLHIIE